MHQKTLYHRQYIIINQEFSRAGQPFRTEGVGDQKGSEGHKNKGSTLHGPWSYSTTGLVALTA